MANLVEQAGGLLKQTRIENGLTQQELGDRLGLNRSTVNRYESGGHNLTLETFEKVLAAMDKKVTLIIE